MRASLSGCRVRPRRTRVLSSADGRPMFIMENPTNRFYTTAIITRGHAVTYKTRGLQPTVDHGKRENMHETNLPKTDRVPCADITSSRPARLARVRDRHLTGIITQYVKLPSLSHRLLRCLGCKCRQDVETQYV